MIEIIKTHQLVISLICIGLIVVIYTLLRAHKMKVERRKILSYLKGINYIIDDKTDKAIEELTSTIELDESLVDVYISIGNLFRKKGEVNRALIIHKGLLARKLDRQKKIEVYVNIGMDYKKAGLYDRAKETFKNALSLDPKNPTVRKYLEEVYEDSRDWESALVWQKRFGDNKKIIAHIYCELGKKILKENADTNASYDMFKKALQEDKTCIDAMLHIGNLQYKQSTEEALNLYFKAINMKPEYTNLFLEQITDVNIAYDFIKRLLIENPKNMYIVYFCAYYSFKFGYYKKTLSLVRLFTKSFPNTAKVAIVFLTTQCLSKQLDSVSNEKFYNNKWSKQLKITKEILGSTHYDTLKNPVKYTCRACGYSSYILFWKCPKCRTWDSAKVEI